MRILIASVVVGVLTLSGLDSNGAAQSASDAELVFFETKVRPLLAEHCWSCHGEKKAKGGLRLHTLEEIQAGGDSGAAFSLEAPNESLILSAVRYEDFEMPPSGPLDEQEIEVLGRWIDLGAPWPAESPDRPARSPAERISKEDRKWWAFQPVSEPEIPKVEHASWANSPIDAFLLASMRKHGLEPAPKADRTSLVRRIYFDLLGVPPSEAELDEFLNDASDKAYETLVDRVLADRRYGERWAQHWLDLTRYADSDGYRADFYRPHAWRYRDYVIRSLNEDKPYDRFVQEQLAGDEMFPDSIDAKIATSFLRNWVYEYNLRDARGQWDTILSDVTDTAGDVFLGVGMQCAKCHDHKFDPILQEDYFRLRAFFEPLLPVEEEVATAQERAQYERDAAAWDEATKEIREELDAIEAPYREKAQAQATNRFPPDIQEMMRKPPDERTPEEKQLAALAHRQVEYEWERLETRIKGDDKKRYDALKAELKMYDSLKPKPLPRAIVAVDVDKEAPPTTIPGAGDDAVAPGYLTILDPQDAVVSAVEGRATTGRRTALARWLTREDNPLSTRVIVNRVWQYHFGKGIAPNSSDFGRLAGEPTHPELLDWLTVQFLRDGWSLKKLHRRILLTEAYQQSTDHPRAQELAALDPHNEWYWRGETRRLDAEQIRDSILVVSGDMNWDRGGEGYAGDKPRRSIYRRFMRNSRDPFLDVFDLPLFFNSESSRNTTTTPLQSLLLINSEKMVRHARSLADRALGADSDPRERLRHLWRVVFSREATEHELESAFAFLAKASEIALQDNQKRRSSMEMAELGELAATRGLAVDISPDREKRGLQVDLANALPKGDFTIECYFRVRSIYESGAVRTLVSLRDGDKAGWAFGVTGKGSRRKPQTMVIQLWGTQRNGSFGEVALFSDADVILGHDYYAAVTVRLAKDNAGVATFYLKDLTEPEAPLQVVTLSHEISASVNPTPRMVIGGRGMSHGSMFDGLIDRVRLTEHVLPTDTLLVTALGDDTRSEASGEKDSSSVAAASVTGGGVLGYWDFPSRDAWNLDLSAKQNDILPPGAMEPLADPERVAWVDLCHALLNSNEFLYVD